MRRADLPGPLAIYVFVAQAGEAWAGAHAVATAEHLSSLSSSDLAELPGFAGVAPLFVLSDGSAGCANCLRNAPTITVDVDVTAALRAAKLPRAQARRRTPHRRAPQGTAGQSRPEQTRAEHSRTSTHPARRRCIA